MDCTPTCRLASHASIILSAITREDLPTFQSIAKKVCSNPTNLTDRLGRHAVHVAASCGKADILEWLVKECKVDVGLRDLESGWTPLHRSLFYGRLTCAVKLLQHGADLYAIDKDDLTPLDSVKLDSPFKLSISVEGKVISNYETKLDDELSLHVSDVVTNIHMTGPNYWTGNLKGARGFFPKDCVQLIKQDYRNDLFTWGANTNFTLGHRDESVRQNPELVEILSNDKSISIKQVVMCKFHSVFLSQDGRVFSCGHGRGGRLGHGDEQTQLAPKQVKGLKEYRCVSVAAAQDHTVVVTHSGLVLTFGLNDMHQLGHTSAPSQCVVPTKIQMKSWKGKHMIGVAASRYHTVFYTHNEVYTCGLNIGQLGQLKGEKFHTTPRQVTALYHKDITISMVTCNDAATVCATSKGDIFVLSQFSCQKAVSRFPELTQMLVAGGDVDLNTNYEAVKVHDHATLTLLNAKGLVYQWKESYGGIQRCKWLLTKELLIADVAVGKQLYVITDRGEMFTCTKAGGGHPVVKPTRSSSSASQSSPFGDWDQKDVISYNVTRCPMVHRGVKVFTDRNSKGFAVLQVDPSTGLEKRPNVRKSSMCEDMKQLLEETMVEDDIHDVHLDAKGHIFPVHAFILASRSPTFHKLLIEEYNKISESDSEAIMTVKLDDVDDHCLVTKYLQDLYSGLQVNDSLLFSPKTNKAAKKTRHYKPEDGKHTNGLEKDSEELSSVLMQNYEEFAMADLDNFSALSLLDKDNSLGEFAGCTDSAKKKSKNTTKTKTKIQINSNQDRKKGQKDIDVKNVFRGFKFKRTDCPEFHDVTIESEDGVSFLCHKCILIARLDYFRSMLACGWLEASKEMKVLNMPIHSSVLKIVIDYLYTDEAKAIQGHQDIEFVGNVLVIADQLLIGRLTEICESVMVKLISLKNAMELLEFSCVYNASQLQDSCLEFICCNLSSLLESGCLDMLSEETLDKLSAAYREMVPNMPWRIITPTHDHLPFLNLEPSSSSPRKRRNSSRKRSTKSESEGDQDGDTIVSQKGMLENGNLERKTSESNLDSVFESEGIEEKLEEPEKELSLEVAVENAEEKMDSEKPRDEGNWYRKQAGKDDQHKSPKVKKQTIKQEENIIESTNTSKPQEIPKLTKQVSPSVSPSVSPAWGMTFMSASSPPSSDLRAIMEQEQQTSQPKNKATKSPTTKTPIKIESRGKQSQKEKKRAKMNQQLQASPAPSEPDKTTSQETKTEKPKPKPNPWGLNEKNPAPIRSLRELIKQEEKSHLILPDKTSASVSPRTPNTTGRTSDKGKSEKTSSAKRRISWGLPQVEQKSVQDNKEPSPTVSPRSAWTSSPGSRSPPLTAVSFADILHLQERENTNLNRAKEKPLNLIQLEDRAIQELLEHYGGLDCACEMITVERIPAATATPVWNRERTASAMST